MKSAILKTSLAALMVAGFGMAASADTVVKVLRVEPEPGIKNFFARMEAEFEAANPGIDVQFDYIANEAFKQKLTTLLQSDNRPDLYYSWGGGVLRDQFEAGFTEDITDKVKDLWDASYSAAGVNAFTVDGHIVGAPINAADVVFWTNLDLAAKAGVDIDTIKTWDDFLAAVEQIKAAGITPIVVGGKDKWPLHFYYGYLSVRSAGAEGFAAALANEGDGFAAEEFVRAGTEFQRLVDLEPFQDGFMSTKFEQAAGRFGDGEAVFWLMGDWGFDMQRGASQSGEGIGDENMGLLSFPALEGGKGAPTDTFGGINGWAVAKGASDEAIEFLKFFNSPEAQRQKAAEGLHIPVAKGAGEVIENPLMKRVSENLAASEFHQVFLDQALGADVGATFNDLAADLAQKVITPEEAAETLKEAWEFR